MTNTSGQSSRVTDGAYSASGVWGTSQPRISRNQALTAFKGDTLYAARIGEDIIKIGFTTDLSCRVRTLATYNSAVVEILAFRLESSYDDEQALHAALEPHRARGREYYHPTDEVLAVVNEMRDDFNLPHIAA